MRNRTTAIGLFVLVLALGACDDDNGDDDGGSETSVAFVSPSDGDVVASPVDVVFSAAGVDIVPAGDPVDGEGHLHVMVDTSCLPAGEIIPNDDTHRHFGDGSTTASLELEPGTHTLCLQLGDGIHAATDLTDEITITVE